ncbi:uncharacterized protein B0I36DRAFT_393085 [Microdochium trichocladiopsis]|uniref:SSCRP protein n=1 Tax=Microdochium trichocladiopsis TaxID=1682393 RepID=A0A9P8XVD1_9PEZI|nr:uncharacterized protein B0I36DRAFT_393085 [Microdochium trichocladiopsis]KAH7020868.1 hypothetical protein B0I36DRAFT_393085 [Microdochium trichocladiopsis]
MKSFTVASAALALASGTMATQQAHFCFQNGQNGYNLTVPADGTVVTTEIEVDINIIIIADFNAHDNCHFTWGGSAANTPPTMEFQVGQNGAQQLVVDPPSIITSLSCGGTCIPTSAKCYDSQSGQNLGTCCAGYCENDVCKSW